MLFKNGLFCCVYLEEIGGGVAGGEVGGVAGSGSSTRGSRRCRYSSSANPADLECGGSSAAAAWCSCTIDLQDVAYRLGFDVI